MCECDVKTKTIFLSHEAKFKEQAVALKGILEGTAKEPPKIFLSSDWESLEAGEPWFEPLIKAIKESAAFITIIPRPAAPAGDQHPGIQCSSFRNLWINFEIGLATGCGKKPKVFVFGGVDWSQLEYPLKGIHLIDTGDTNRWIKELQEIGFEINKEVEEKLAKLFNQNQRKCPQI